MAAQASNPTKPKPEASQPWHIAYPAPQTTASSITCEHLLSWMKAGKRPAMHFVLVDLRRTDFEGGTIRGSINLPAQSLHLTIPSLYALFSEAEVTEVIWYCGSSKGRGARAAGWFADYLKERNDVSMESLVLEGGVRCWATAGEEYVELMDGYDAAVWK
ncbi:probable arsenate reductase (Arc2) [Phialocephala subalpina]|uniref:Probable arsenate reductase (Arc2) n=1 Tax=Phialocephala subalpina TaxID=576137 RepID=A0A1L7X0D6_9HELO|nr:probable arsenate reductase (Arc2) [Phialocephala subalpina]